MYTTSKGKFQLELLRILVCFNKTAVDVLLICKLTADIGCMSNRKHLVVFSASWSPFWRGPHRKKYQKIRYSLTKILPRKIPLCISLGCFTAKCTWCPLTSENLQEAVVVNIILSRRSLVGELLSTLFHNSRLDRMWPPSHFSFLWRTRSELTVAAWCYQIYHCCAECRLLLVHYFNWRRWLWRAVDFDDANHINSAQSIVHLRGTFCGPFSTPPTMSWDTEIFPL